VGPSLRPEVTRSTKLCVACCVKLRWYKCGRSIRLMLAREVALLAYSVNFCRLSSTKIATWAHAAVFNEALPAYCYMLMARAGT
jgi:hypothetical protein